MFDLEHGIQNWKQTFRPDTSIGAEGAQEIEAHLRESIERLQSIGLSANEAYAIALHRLGLTADLESEFAKNAPVSAWRTRIAWMLGGYIALTVCHGSVAAFTALIGAWMAVAGVGAANAAMIALAVQAIAWAGLLVVGYRTLLNREYASDRFTWKWAVLAGAVMIVLPIVAILGRMAQMTFVDISWFSASSMWLAYGGVVVNAAVYLSCLVVMCRLSKPLIAVVE